MARVAKWGVISVLLVIAALFALWATSPDPQGNPASFADEPLSEGLAPLDEAITLAQFTSDADATTTLLVVDFTDDTVTGIDLALLGAEPSDDPFTAFAQAVRLEEAIASPEAFPAVSVPMDQLLPSGPGGTQHIGTGTNFPEHAEESNSDGVFQFPKFGPATPARTTVGAGEGVLLDYEVELCMRFDRPIASVEDFDAAIKGVFLCADFTNRNALVNMADPDNLDSGFGFSDAKSGPDYFPTGPFLIIPRDWQRFVANLRMTTAVNGDPRQDASGDEMILDFRGLTEKALSDMDEARFFYQDSFHRLVDPAQINPSATLMSGTSEGVIFTSPSRGDLIETLARYTLAGGPLSGRSLTDTGRATFIANELASGHFLQPGDRVTYGSNMLGTIRVDVVR